MNNNSDYDVELREMNDIDWSNYVSHIVEANEIYYQYGCEPTERLIKSIDTMTPEVVYYSVYLKAENVMVGYVGITPDTSELEFHIFSEFRKRGFGTKAVSLLVQLWFSGQVTGKAETKIMAETLCENQNSIWLLERLGLQTDATGLRIVFSEESEEHRVIGLYVYVLNNDRFNDDDSVTEHCQKKS